MKITCEKCGHVQDIAPRRSRQASAFFHVACGRYASEMGMKAADAKILFKYSYGVWSPVPFRGPTPKWPGQFVLMYEGQPNETLVFMKSEAAYTKPEERRLTEGVKTEMYDAGVDAEDLFE